MSTNALDLSRLLQSERPSLLRILSRVLDRSMVDDALQTLWLRVQKVEDDPPINDKRSYLFALAANVAWDQGRELARRRRIQAQADAILWGAERDPSAETMVIARDELQRVLEAAEQLSEPTRTIFWLNRMEGLPQRDIAVRLGVSRTTVEKHIRRALSILGDARNAGSGGG
jgi:RNA polymerase sigma-70 factor (ECF subfamily)